MRSLACAHVFLKKLLTDERVSSFPMAVLTLIDFFRGDTVQHPAFLEAPPGVVSVTQSGFSSFLASPSQTPPLTGLDLLLPKSSPLSSSLLSTALPCSDGKSASHHLAQGHTRISNFLPENSIPHVPSTELLLNKHLACAI